MLLHSSDLGLKRIQEYPTRYSLSDRFHYSRCRDVYRNQGCQSPVVLRVPWYVPGCYISWSKHSRRWCRLYPGRYHEEHFRYGTRWCDCRHSLLLSPEGTRSYSSGSRHWLTTQPISLGEASAVRATSLIHLSSLLSTLVLSLSRHRLHILCPSFHCPTQACTLPSISCSQSYTQTLSMHL